MKNIIKFSAIVMAAFVIGGCGEMEMSAPEGFVDLGDGYGNSRIQRFSSADNCMVSFRQEANLKNATADFWATAVQTKLTGKGYDFKGSQTIKTVEGMDGVLLKFTKADMSYWTALFVKGDNVYVTEAGGLTKDFTPREAEIVKAFASIRQKKLP